MTGEVISMQAYLEKKAAPTKADLQRRLAEIAVQRMVLASEKTRLEQQLQEIE